MILIGLAIMIVSEGATLAGVEPFASWNTPICWTGFILFADGIVFRARGDSWIRSAPREFAALAAASIPLWLVFEGYNLVIRNWTYVGLPENPALRTFGYAWSFATIWPAVFEAADMVAVVRASRRSSGSSGSGRSGKSPSSPRNLPVSLAPRRAIDPRDRPDPPDPPDPPDLPDPPGLRRSILAIGIGIAMLISPFIVPPPIARYMAAPVWLGFIFLLDPINARLGAETLMPGGRRDRVVNLALSGLLCGVLWEFWNYWSRAKWHYTVPIMEHIKIFEMPVPGYLGFLPFALECFTMYVFVRRMLTHHGRTIAL